MPYFSSKLSDSLSIGFWNVDGVFVVTGVLKTCKLEHESALNLNGFRTFYNCRNKNTTNNRYYGGISVFIKESLLYGIKVLPPTTSFLNPILNWIIIFIFV
jgi:hypothetical protein